ncbi:recombinase family protein [Bradyrhizobium sp. 25ACV]
MNTLRWSGRANERPQCQGHRSDAGNRKARSTSRSASSTLALRDSGVKFACCDMPEANDLTIGVLAVVAQAEAQAISRRTKDAMQLARRRIGETGSVAIQRSGDRAIATALIPSASRERQPCGYSESAGQCQPACQ